MIKASLNTLNHTFLSETSESKIQNTKTFSFVGFSVERERGWNQIAHVMIAFVSFDFRKINTKKLQRHCLFRINA